MIRAKIISIGDEILIGQIVNGNAAYIGEKLYSIGIPADKILSIGDKEEPLLKELEDSMENYEITILTGGLGPTHDDITKPILVQFFEDELIPDEKVLKHVEEIFTRRDMKMPEINKEQAMVPAKAKILWNEQGTAPGLWMEKDDHIIVALPGVPYEMKEMMKFVIDMLKDKFFSKLDGVYKSKNLLTTGISESGLFEMLGNINDITGEGNKLAFLPSAVGVKLRIDVKGSSEDDAKELIHQIEGRIKEKAGNYLFGENEDTLERIIGKLLLEKKYMLSLAESCTGGHLSSTIVNIEGSSEYYLGGVCSYANDAKMRLLGVSEKTLMQHGAVSEETAIEMAAGAREHFGSDMSLSTTGIAGPSGGTELKPVGTVWIGYSDKDKAYAKKFMFGNNRERNIQRSTYAALEILRKELMKL